MVHLRIVVPSHDSEHVLDLLEATPSACNVIFLERAAQKPVGDVILCDIAREDASVIISDLKEFGIHHEGSIAMENIDSEISDAADAAVLAARGMPTDAVVWEEVEARTSENTELVGELPAVHGARVPDRLRRHPARLSDPDHRGDGRRPGVRPDRRLLRRDRPAPRRPGEALPAAAGDRIPARDRRRLPVLARGQGTGPDPGGLLGHRAPPDPVHLQPGRVQLHRRRARGHCWNPLAHQRQVRAPWSAS